MKKFNFTKLIVFVMTIALLIGTALCVTAMADEADTKGEFGGISVSYGDRVYIRVQVNATEEEIAKLTALLEEQTYALKELINRDEK